MAQPEDGCWWFVGHHRTVRRHVVRRGLPWQAGIPEVGAGTGGDPAMMAGCGQVQAIEMDEFARSPTPRRAPGVEVCDGSVPDRIPIAAASMC